VREGARAAGRERLVREGARTGSPARSRAQEMPVDHLDGVVTDRLEVGPELLLRAARGA
jgi:hypothetical protein